MASTDQPNVPWRKSPAKKLLRELILDNTVSEETDARLLHESYDEFRVWPFINFQRNLKSLIQSVRDGKTEKKPSKWRKSKARQMLKEDIVSGNVTDDMEPRVVYIISVEYQMYAFDRFKSYLDNLKEAIYRDFERMERDCIDYGHDLQAVMEIRKDDPPSCRPWNLSECKKFLEEDVKDGKHTALAPKVLYESRPEYRAYTLKEFRDHIYQERDRQAKREQRFAKKRTRLQHPSRVDRVVDDAPRRREEDPSDLSSLKVAELKEMLRVRGLKVSGKKAELIERLNNE